MSTTRSQKFYAALVGVFLGVTICLGALYLSMGVLSVLGLGFVQYTRRWIEYVSAGLVFFFMASIPLVVRSSGWSLGSADKNAKSEEASRAFFGHLGQIGLSATLIKYHPSRSYSNIIGAARIAGRNIDLIELGWREYVRNLGGGLDPETGGSTPDLYVYKSQYRCNYLVEATVEGSEDKLEAKGTAVKRKEFIRRRVVDFKWEGKELAQALNNDVELKRLLVSPHRSPTLKIEPNRRGYPYVRIAQTNWHYRVRSAFPSYRDFEIYDRIGKHIRRIAYS